MNSSQPTKNFEKALVQSQDFAQQDPHGFKWCVTTKHGVYLACQYAYALEKAYPLICVTLSK